MIQESHLFWAAPKWLSLSLRKRKLGVFACFLQGHILSFAFYPDGGLFTIIPKQIIKRSPDFAKVCKILLLSLMQTRVWVDVISMKVIHRIQCLPNKHIYFINGSFTSLLIHLFLELGIGLFRVRIATSSPASGDLYPIHTGVSISKISIQYPGIRAAFFLLLDFWDKGQLVRLPNELPTRRGHRGIAELKVYDSQVSV